MLVILVSVMIQVIVIILNTYTRDTGVCGELILVIVIILNTYARDTCVGDVTGHSNNTEYICSLCWCL